MLRVYNTRTHISHRETHRNTPLMAAGFLWQRSHDLLLLFPDDSRIVFSLLKFSLHVIFVFWAEGV